MKVIVASKNPVKIKAAQKGFESYLGDKVEVEGCSVESGVSDQPMTDEETLLGAKNRVNNAQNAFPEADYWIGIEGGLHPSENGLVAFAWIVVKSKTAAGQSRTTSFLLPKPVSDLIAKGYELGVANDIIFHENNSKQKRGAVGILSKGVVDRTELYIQAVQLALIPIMNEELYCPVISAY